MLSNSLKDVVGAYFCVEHQVAIFGSELISRLFSVESKSSGVILSHRTVLPRCRSMKRWRVLKIYILRCSSMSFNHVASPSVPKKSQGLFDTSSQERIVWWLIYQISTGKDIGLPLVVDDSCCFTRQALHSAEEIDGIVRRIIQEVPTNKADEVFGADSTSIEVWSYHVPPEDEVKLWLS